MFVASWSLREGTFNPGSLLGGGKVLLCFKGARIRGSWVAQSDESPALFGLKL